MLYQDLSDLAHRAAIEVYFYLSGREGVTFEKVDKFAGLLRKKSSKKF